MPAATIARRYALWLLICTISAAPSFVLAWNMGASPAGMIAAVLLFAFAYGAISCTAWFERIHARPFVRETLYVGYGLRLALSLLTGLAALIQVQAMMWVLMPDMVCGLMSSGVVRLALGVDGRGGPYVETFAGAFLTTCVQGALLNVIVFLVMAIAYGLQRAVRRTPPEKLRGFEVVPTIAERVP